MTDLICLKDSYMKEMQVSVSKVEGNKVEFDKTIFYPTGGGQPTDLGVVKRGSIVFNVINVKKENGCVWHEINPPGLAVGDVVVQEIDWVRRYKLMRMHTAAHVLGAVMFEKNVLVTGNQLGVDQTRFDFNCETGLERELFDSAIKEVNEKLALNVDVRVSEMPREQALAIPGMVKLADKLPPSLSILRIVEIPGLDVQADGGTHVRNTREVGKIKLEKIENKGSKNKRIYFSLE